MGDRRRGAQACCREGLVCRTHHVRAQAVTPAIQIDLNRLHLYQVAHQIGPGNAHLAPFQPPLQIDLQSQGQETGHDIADRGVVAMVVDRGAPQVLTSVREMCVPLARGSCRSARPRYVVYRHYDPDWEACEYCVADYTLACAPCGEKSWENDLNSAEVAWFDRFSVVLLCEDCPAESEEAAENCDDLEDGVALPGQMEIELATVQGRVVAATKVKSQKPFTFTGFRNPMQAGMPALRQSAIRARLRERARKDLCKTHRTLNGRI